MRVRDASETGAGIPVDANWCPCAFGSEQPDGSGCGNVGVAWSGRVLLCERHIKEVEAREQREHWEEVNLYLDLWTKVAHARENATLSRLLRYARLESQTDRECARESLEKAVKAGSFRE